jgi:hypothetical protein
MTSSRRDFLRYSTTAAAGLAIAAMSQPSLFAAAKTGSALLSVAFVPDLPASSVRLNSLANNPSIDPLLVSRGARISTRGGQRADKYLKNPGGIAVDAVFPSSRHVCFWSATKSCTTKVTTVVPAVAGSGVPVSVQCFTTKGESLLNLGQRGVYVIALCESASDVAPTWSRLDLVRDGNRFTVPGLATGYVILSVDYAS